MLSWWERKWAAHVLDEPRWTEQGMWSGPGKAGLNIVGANISIILILISPYNP